MTKSIFCLIYSFFLTSSVSRHSFFFYYFFIYVFILILIFVFGNKIKSKIYWFLQFKWQVVFQSFWNTFSLIFLISFQDPIHYFTFQSAAFELRINNKSYNWIEIKQSSSRRPSGQSKIVKCICKKFRVKLTLYNNCGRYCCCYIYFFCYLFYSQNNFNVFYFVINFINF